MWIPIKWSGKRGSNSRPQPWQGCALPAELFPHLKWMLNITPIEWAFKQNYLIFYPVKKASHKRGFSPYFYIYLKLTFLKTTRSTISLISP